MTYDIVEGEFKGYYEEMRKNNPEWGWAGAYVKSYKKSALPMFKRFCTAVSRSNGKYVFDGGKVNSDEKTLRGKKVGLILGEEEYEGNDGTIKTRLYVVREFSIDKIGEQKVPPVALQYRRIHPGFPYDHGPDEPSGNPLRMPVPPQ